MLVIKKNLCKEFTNTNRTLSDQQILIFNGWGIKSKISNVMDNIAAGLITKLL